jgi:hypothetical protein
MSDKLEPKTDEKPVAKPNYGSLEDYDFKGKAEQLGLLAVKGFKVGWKIYQSVGIRTKQVCMAGGVVFLALGFWPTGKSDVIGGALSLKCGFLHWNQSVTLEDVTLDCECVHNKSNDWIMLRQVGEDKNNKEVIPPRSSHRLFFVHHTFSEDISVGTVILDREKPVLFSIPPGEKVKYAWGYRFSIMDSGGDYYLDVVGEAGPYTVQPEIVVVYQGKTYEVIKGKSHNAILLGPTNRFDIFSPFEPLEFGLKILDR